MTSWRIGWVFCCWNQITPGWSPRTHPSHGHTLGGGKSLEVQSNYARIIYSNLVLHRAIAHISDMALLKIKTENIVQQIFYSLSKTLIAVYLLRQMAVSKSFDWAQRRWTHYPKFLNKSNTNRCLVSKFVLHSNNISFDHNLTWVTHVASKNIKIWCKISTNILWPSIIAQWYS